MRSADTRWRYFMMAAPGGSLSRPVARLALCWPSIQPCAKLCLGMARSSRWVAVAAVLASSVVLLSAQPVFLSPRQTPPAIDFTRDIQPIFQQYCYECHGPKTARAHLQLHSPELILSGGDSGPIIEPGNSRESEIIRRVTALAADDRMPRDADPLPPATIA